MADRVGEQLGNYQLIRLIGEGGFAEVYLGEHIHLGTQAAIKVLQARLASGDIEHFHTEARTIASLVHPRIVRVLDFGVESNVPYLVMSYAPRGTLRQLHPRGTRLPLTSIVLYVKQVAEALQYAHQRKLIHRDIKPENMLIGRNNEVLLSDFGIAVLAQSSRYEVTQKVAGTIYYMAPEQLQGKARFASDQYALGIVVYEWLCGERPFRGSFTEIASQHIFTAPPPLHEKVPQLSSSVEEVVLRALAKDPQQRFASVEAFADALEEASESPLTLHQLSDEMFSPEAPQTATSRQLVADSRTVLPLPASQEQITWQMKPETTARERLPLSGRKRVPSKGRIALLLLAALLLIAGGSYAYTALSTYRTQATATTKVARSATVKAVINDYRTYVAAYGIMYGFDARHTRNNPYERKINVANVSQLSQKWIAQTASSIISSPEVTNGIVYVGSQDGKLYAFEAATGQQKWAAQTAGPIRSSPAVANGVVYIGSYDHKLYAFDAVSGQMKWAAPTGGAIESSPAVVGGLVYVGSLDYRLYAFDAVSGQQKWAAPTGSAIESSPAVVGGVVYVGSDDSTLYAFDAGSGKWVAPTGNAIYSSPAVVDGVVYVGSLDHKLYAFDAVSGQQKWVATTGNAIISSPAVANGVVYIGSLDHKLYAFDAATGKQKWSTQTGDAITISSPTVANGVVYVGSLDHKLYAFDAVSGQQKWAAPTTGRIFSSPSVVNGMVYVGSDDGKFYAFSLS